jgi:hypothetical protein
MYPNLVYEIFNVTTPLIIFVFSARRMPTCFSHISNYLFSSLLSLNIYFSSFFYYFLFNHTLHYMQGQSEGGSRGIKRPLDPKTFFLPLVEVLPIPWWPTFSHFIRGIDNFQSRPRFSQTHSVFRLTEDISVFLFHRYYFLMSFSYLPKTMHLN